MYGKKFPNRKKYYGRIFTEEAKKKISIANTGKSRTLEHRLNLSKSQKGLKKSEEHKRKIGEANKGNTFKHTEEAKKKISECSRMPRKFKNAKPLF